MTTSPSLWVEVEGKVKSSSIDYNTEEKPSCYTCGKGFRKGQVVIMTVALRQTERFGTDLIVAGSGDDLQVSHKKCIIKS